MARCRPLLLAVLTALVAAGLPAGAAADDSRLFVVAADHGVLAPTKAGHALVLGGVERPTWFDDRPTRAAGRLAPATLVRRWRDYGFLAERPNAALRVGTRTVVVTLGRPRYRARGRVLRFPVRGVTRLPRARVRLAQPSLFIDDASPGVVSGPPPIQLYVTPTVRIVLYPAANAAQGVRVTVVMRGAVPVIGTVLTPASPVAKAIAGSDGGTSVEVGQAELRGDGRGEWWVAFTGVRIATAGGETVPFDGIVGTWLAR